MKPLQTLLRDLRKIGATLKAVDGRLHCDVPAAYVTPTLKAELNARKQEILAFLEGGDGASESLRKFAARPASEPVPPASAQKRLWFIDQLDEGGSAYNTAVALRLRGRVPPPALEQSLAEIQRRHESLRATFPTRNGEPIQRFHETVARTPLVDLTRLTREDRQPLLGRLAEENFQRRFCLATGPVFRARQALLEPGVESGLLSAMHHIVADEWSLGVFFRELSEIYGRFQTGAASELADPPVQYRHYAGWQEEWLTDDRLTRLHNYWDERLAGAPTLLDWKNARPRPPRASFRGGSRVFQLDAALVKRLEDLAGQTNSTLFMTLLGGYAALLGQLTGSADIPVGAPMANRIPRETEALIGFFANTLALRCDLSGDPAFNEVLNRVRDVTVGAHEHQEMPFEKLVERLSPERDLSFNPLVQAGFVLQTQPMGLPELAHVEVERMPLEIRAAKFDLVLLAEKVGDGLRAELLYSEDLFAGSTMDAVVDHFGRLLHALVDDPAIRLSELPIFSPADDATWSDGDRLLFRNGCPVHPGLVEEALLDCPGVTDCHVAERCDHGERKLAAYVAGPGELGESQLQDELRQRLPAYAMPDVLVPVSALPLKADGVVDADRLAQLPTASNERLREYEAGLERRPEVDRCVAVKVPRPTVPERLHLRDLLPDWRARQTRGEVAPAADVEASNDLPATSGDVAAVVTGGPLPAEVEAVGTLGNGLRRAADLGAGRGILTIAADGEERFIAYAELYAMARRVGAKLRRGGVQPEDKLVLLCGAADEFLIAFWSCVHAGVIPALVAPPTTFGESNRSLDAMLACWRHLGRPRILLGQSLRSAADELSVFLPEEEFEFLELADLLAESGDDEFQAVDIDPRTVAAILFTSGSTGTPKGVMLSHRNLLSMAAGTVTRNGLHADDVTLNWMPLHHIGAIGFLSVLPMFLGCQQIHADTGRLMQEPLRWPDLLSRQRVSVSWATNSAFGLITDRAAEIEGRNWDLSGLRFLVSAGEPVSGDTLRRFVEVLAPHGFRTEALHPAFGMTETCSGITWADRFDLDSATDEHGFVEVGPPIPGAAVRVVDDLGKAVSEGVVGDVEFQGDSVMLGYYEAPEFNQAAFTSDGWLRSGDRGYLREGRFTITSRKDSIIIVRGANFYSHEIEAVVEGVGGVARTFTAACAVREPGAETDLVVIFFAPDTDPSDGADLIVEIGRQVAAQFGIRPDYIIPVRREEIPKSAIGKILRKQLVRKFEAGEFEQHVIRADLATGNENTLPDWFFRRTWVRRGADSLSHRWRDMTAIVICGRGISEALMRRWQTHFRGVICVEDAIDATEAGRYEAVFDAAVGSPSVAIIHLGFLAGVAQGGYDALLTLLPIVMRRGVGRDWRFLMFTGNEAEPESAALGGLLRAASAESEGVAFRLVEVDRRDESRLGETVLRETAAISCEPEAAWRGDVRFVPRLEGLCPLRSGEEGPVIAPGLYLISGGLGGIGLELAEYLLERFDVHLLLIGRVELSDRSAGERRTRWEKLRERFAERVIYQSADICDPKVADAVVAAEEVFAERLAGVFHLAGDGELRDLNTERAELLAQTMAPKLTGARVLSGLLRERSPQGLFVAFSSVTAFFGGMGTGAYAAANRAMEVFVERLRAESDLRCYTLSWSLWRDIGLGRGHASPEAIARQGLLPLIRRQGLLSLEIMLRCEPGSYLIGLNSKGPLVRTWAAEQSCALQEVRVFYSPAKDSSPTPDQPDELPSMSWQRVDEWPLTPDGEIDRRRLVAGGGGEEVEIGEVPVEEVRKMCGLWQALLRRDVVAPEDDFFALGGHSLAAMQLLARVQDVFGVELAVRDLFEHSTAAGMTRRALNAATVETKSIRREMTAGEWPLSFTQQRLWLLNELEPDNAAYNMPLLLSLEGPRQDALVRASVDEIVRRHQTLRVRFSNVAGSPAQSVLPVGDCPPERCVDLSGLSAADVAVTRRRLTVSDAGRPFRLDAEAPHRRIWIVEGSRSGLLIVNLHHIVADGWSIGVFLQELEAIGQKFGAGAPHELAELPIQFGDYAAWQRREMDAAASERLLDFWRTELDGAVATLALPTDRRRPPVQTFAGGVVEFEIDPGLTERLDRLGRSLNATQFMVLFSGFAAALSRRSGQSDISIGIPAANRPRPETEALMGFFANTLVLRAQLDDMPSASDLIARIRQRHLDAMAHQDMPFERLVQALQPERDFSHSPLFQVMFIMQNAPLAEGLDLGRGLKGQPLTPEQTTSKFDLTLSIQPWGDGLKGACEYNSDLFDRATIERFAAGYLRLLEDMVDHPDRRVSELEILPGSERELTVRRWNEATVREAPKPATTLEWIEATARQFPDRAAVSGGGRVLTYGQLLKLSGAVARELIACGVAREQPVGVMLDRSPEMVAALLGVWMAGGAYVPMDPEFPAERIDGMVRDAGVVALVTLGATTRHHTEDCMIVDIGRLRADAFDPVRRPPMPEQLAYIIYTSGSTGRPKGVQISHGALVNFLRSMIREPGIHADDALLAVTTISFDIAALELFAPLICGGRVIVADRETVVDGERISAALVTHNVTVMQATPVTWRMLLTAGWNNEKGAKILCGGEALPADLGARLVAMGETWNLYGPTETTVWSTAERLGGSLAAARADSAAAIGRPIDNTEVFILDRQLRPVPIGVPGELYLGGRGLARGYRGRPDLTAERFVPHPFAEDGRLGRGDPRLYRTGDLARHFADGRIEYLGRMDAQLKLRGFRIEPGEIEAALTELPAVRQAVVILRTDRIAMGELVAFVVNAEGVTEPQGWREHASRKLPDYMIPSVVIPVAELPLTANGKVDRRRLGTAPLPTDVAEPGDPETVDSMIEDVLSGLWADVLGRDKVGRHDDFFELGGHSLVATQLIARTRDALGIELPLRSLFERGTVATLTEEIEAGRRNSTDELAGEALLPVSRGTRLPLSFGQERLWVLNQLEQRRAYYNMPLALRLGRKNRVSPLAAAFVELTRRHEGLRTLFPEDAEGPHQLVREVAFVSAPLVDLRGLPAATRERVVKRLVDDDARRPFDLKRELPARLKLALVAPGEDVMLLSLHHIISDAASNGILLRELAALYQAGDRGCPADLREPEFQYADFAVWQRRDLSGNKLERQLAFWSRRLADAPATTGPPADFPRPAVRRYAGASVTLGFDADLSRQLRELGRRQGCSLFMTLFSGYAATLGSLAGQDDLVIGSPMSSRTHAELEKAVGFFVNTLALRVDVSGNPAFTELLDQVRRESLAAYENRELPFEKVVETLRLPRDTDRYPLIQTVFAFQDAPFTSLPELDARPLSFYNDLIRFEVEVFLWEKGDEIAGYVLYDTELYRRDTIVELRERFEQFLREAVERPEATLAELNIDEHAVALPPLTQSLAAA